jgi:hypothetical protein
MMGGGTLPRLVKALGALARLRPVLIRYLLSKAFEKSFKAGLIISRFDSKKQV